MAGLRELVVSPGQGVFSRPFPPRILTAFEESDETTLREKTSYLALQRQPKGSVASLSNRSIS